MNLTSSLVVHDKIKFTIQRTFDGLQSALANDCAPDNSYFGYRSGYSGFGAACFANTIIGTQAGNNNQSSQHVFVG